MATRRSSFGFVLLEIVSVTGITATLASFTIPTLFQSTAHETPALERPQPPAQDVERGAVEHISFAPEGGVYIHCRRVGEREAPRCEATVGMNALEENELWRDAGCVTPANKPSALTLIDPERHG